MDRGTANIAPVPLSSPGVMPFDRHMVRACLVRIPARRFYHKRPTMEPTLAGTSRTR